MSLVADVDLLIRAGDTFSKVFRWGAGPVVYRRITAIAQAAPARLTVPAHGLVSGWPVAVSNVLGMTEINAGSTPPRAADFARATVVDVDTIELNAGGFSRYKSGGTIQYPTPVDLTSFSAELLIYVDHAVPLRFSSVAGDIVLDNEAKAITLRIAATVTALMRWTRATYDFNLINGTDVSSLAGGNVFLDVGTGAPQEL